MFKSWIQKQEQTIVQTTQKLLQIPSVGTEAASVDKPFGLETDRALNFMLELGEKYGFHVQNVDGYAGHIEYGTGDEYVSVLAHLDVVPAGSGWTYPAFGAEIHDGKIYARGALDDKGPAMAAFFGLLAVKESGLPLNKRVRLILGIDEEKDWKCMERYFKKEPLPWGGFTPDADFPLIFAEKGILQFTLTKPRKMVSGVKVSLLEITGGERPNMVPDHCQAIFSISPEYKDEFVNHVQGFCSETGIDYNLAEKDTNQIYLEVIGKSAHGSLPELGINAIHNMAQIIKSLSIDESELWELLASFDPEGRFLGIQCSDDVTGSLSCNLGMLKADGNSIQIIFDCRYPIDQTGEKLVQLIQSKSNSVGLVLTINENKKPLYVSKDSTVVTTLQQVYEKETGYSATPIAIGGGTYARTIPNAVAFGPMFPGMKDLAHQKDECIEIEHLMQITGIYAEAIYELAK